MATCFVTRRTVADGSDGCIVFSAILRVVIDIKASAYADRIATGPEWTETIICSLGNITFIIPWIYNVPMRMETVRLSTTLKRTCSCKYPKRTNNRTVSYMVTWSPDANLYRMLGTSLIFCYHAESRNDVRIKFGPAPFSKTKLGGVIHLTQLLQKREPYRSSSWKTRFCRASQN